MELLGVFPDGENAKTGSWIPVEPGVVGYTCCFACSHCGQEVVLPTYDLTCGYRYCPNCGAEMSEKNF